jgi:nucleotidyltransferase substrate binding protein (TIGR01987 family)
MLIMQGKISIEPLLKTKAQLDKAITQAKTDLEITGAIKCFEYSYEISWKIMKKILEAMGITDINNPRAVFAAAYKNKLIDDLAAWNSYISKRNLTSHTYDQELAHDVFNSLKGFSQHLETFIQNIRKL